MFLAKDVAEWIDYDVSSINKLLSAVDGEEKVRKTVPTLGGNQIAWLLTEDGLYEVLMQSRKPIAKAFKREVKAILKSIRKHGAYLTKNKLEEMMSHPASWATLLTALTEERAKNEQLQIEAEKNAPLVNFAEVVQGAENSILVRECAKLVKERSGIKIGERRLYQKLRDWGLVLKNKNEPTQRAYAAGYLELIENPYNKWGETYIGLTTKVTPKGQVYIINKLIKEAIAENKSVTLNPAS